MQTAATKIDNSAENLSIQAAAARARATELVASFQAIRQRAAQTRIQNAELRAACRELRLQCRQNAQRSAARRRIHTPYEPEAVLMAQAIARALAEIGVPAFVFEPPQDTAMQL